MGLMVEKAGLPDTSEVVNLRAENDLLKAKLIELLRVALKKILAKQSELADARSELQDQVRQTAGVVADNYRLRSELNAVSDALEHSKINLDSVLDSLKLVTAERDEARAELVRVRENLRKATDLVASHKRTFVIAKLAYEYEAE